MNPLTWPSGPHNYYYPWWRIIWNWCWLPALWVCKWSFLICVFMIKGPAFAHDMEKEMAP